MLNIISCLKMQIKMAPSTSEHPFKWITFQNLTLSGHRYCPPCCLPFPSPFYHEASSFPKVSYVEVILATEVFMVVLENIKPPYNSLLVIFMSSCMPCLLQKDWGDFILISLNKYWVPFTCYGAGNMRWNKSPARRQPRLIHEITSSDKWPVRRA